MSPPRHSNRDVQHLIPICPPGTHLVVAAGSSPVAARSDPAPGNNQLLEREIQLAVFIVAALGALRREVSLVYQITEFRRVGAISDAQHIVQPLHRRAVHVGERGLRHRDLLDVDVLLEAAPPINRRACSLPSLSIKYVENSSAASSGRPNRGTFNKSNMQCPISCPTM